MPRKSGMKPSFRKKVQAIVRDEIQEELEEKVAVIGFSDVDTASSNIPSGAVGGSSNFIKLLPNIEQVGRDDGSGNIVPSSQYNVRNGNEIRLKEIDIKMLMYNTNGQEEGNRPSTSLGVRVMILRQKDDNDMHGFIQNAQTNKLLENGEITNAGPASFSGKTFNLFQKINREQFSVRYDKTFYLDPIQVLVNPTSNNTYTYKSARPTFMSHKLTFGKRGLKLTFADGVSDSPTNFPYMMVIGYASTVSPTVPDNREVVYSYTSNASYTDA